VKEEEESSSERTQLYEPKRADQKLNQAQEVHPT